MKIRTLVKFESSHRLLKDGGKCFNLHGHNFKAEIEVVGSINSQGYVIDFKEIKKIFETLDHATILEDGDPLIEPLKSLNQKLYILDNTPSCENLAEHIIEILFNKYSNIRFCSIKLLENEDSWAIATR